MLFWEHIIIYRSFPHTYPSGLIKPKLAVDIFRQTRIATEKPTCWAGRQIQKTPTICVFILWISVYMKLIAIHP